MPYANPKELLVAATALPAKIEERLPPGAPAISARLVEFAEKLPTLPDFPVALPDLPPIPELPTMPGAGGELGRKRFVTEVREVKTVPTPVAAPRAIVPLVFE